MAKKKQRKGKNMQLKRILIPLLAILMICLAAVAPVSAAEAAPSFKVSITATVNGEKEDLLLVQPGDTFTVTAFVVANPGVTSAEFTLLYNPEALEVVTVDDKLSYTCFDDVFALNESKTAVWGATAGEILWRYLDGEKTNKVGRLVEVSFKVKEGFHGDFGFATKNGALALNGLDQVSATATVGYAGVHDVAGEAIEKAATCTEAASKSYHCNTCNEDVVIYYGEALGHAVEKKAAFAGNCTVGACVAHFYCERCDGYFLDAAATMQVEKSEVVQDAPGHTTEMIPGKAATCTEPGMTDRIYCKVCQQDVQAQTVIPALGHTIVIDPAVEPTDGNPGLTEGKHCSTCGMVLVPQDTVNPSSLVWLWILLVVVVVAAAGVVAYFFIFKKRVKRY